MLVSKANTWSLIVFGYASNSLLSLMLVFGSEDWFEFVQGFVVLAIIPAFGAYVIYLSWRIVQPTQAKLFYYFMQLFLLVLVFKFHFIILSTYGFKTYSRQILYLSPSLIVPWLFYAIALSSLAYFVILTVCIFKRLKRLIERT